MKLYFVGTRLYDPETGRFINADDVSNLNMQVIGGMNLFASKLSISIMQNSTSSTPNVHTYTQAFDKYPLSDVDIQFFTNINNSFGYVNTLWGGASTLIDSRYRINYASKNPYSLFYGKYYNFNDSQALNALDDLRWLKRAGYVFTALDGILTTASYLERGYSVGESLKEGFIAVSTSLISGAIGAKWGAMFGSMIGGPVGFAVGVVAGFIVSMVVDWSLDLLIENL